VEMHPIEKIWVPEMIFANLLTGVNYTDAGDKKIVGGKNGYGAKLCNIFSTEFIIETVDSFNKKYYKQVCLDNMTKIFDPEIKPFTGKPFTRITFKPDLVKFNLLEGIPEDTIKIMEKRAWDAAAYTHDCHVTFNDQKIFLKDFEKYVDLFIGSKA